MGQTVSSSTTSGVSSASSATALMNLVGTSTQAGQTDVADQFKALLQQLIGNPLQGSLTQQQLTELLAKQNGGQSGSTGADAGSTSGKASSVANSQISSALDGSDPSAALISEIAALIQKYPALQQIFSGKIDTNEIQLIANDLTKANGTGAVPDFSNLTLPDDLKSELQSLAQDPSANEAFQDVAKQLQASPSLAAQIPQALQNFISSSSSAQAMLQPTNTQQPTNSNNSSNASSNNVSSNITTTTKQPQGLFKSSNALAQQTATAQQAQAADPSNNPNTSQTASDGNGANSNLSGADDADELNVNSGALHFFTAADVGLSLAPSIDPNAAALLQTGTTNVSLGGVVSAALTAQELTNAAAVNPAVLQVAVQIQRNAQTNNNDFTVQLHPAELGAIQVSLKFNGDKVQAKVTADKEETLNYLKQDQGSLTKALNSAGLQTDANSLEFSLNGGSAEQSANQSAQNNLNSNSFGTRIASSTTDETSDTQTASMQWYTLDAGRVDVKL